MKPIHILLVPCLLLCACAGTDVANRYYLTETYPPKEPKDVEILTKKPTREFILMADFQAYGETDQQMQKRAAQIGADAVIVTHLGGYRTLSEWPKTESNPPQGAMSPWGRTVGAAIKYK